MSPAAFHRHFRAITAMSRPLQFQKHLRGQDAARLRADADPHDLLRLP
jgi:hypothetical protein